MKKFLTSYPKLLKEWHPEKNKNISPSNLSHGSSKSIWWLCNCGNEYKAEVRNRTIRNSGCRLCANKKPKSWQKKVTINGKNYDSIKNASKKLNISEDTLRKYIKKEGATKINLPKTYYLDKRFKNNKNFTTGSLKYLKEIARENGLVNLEDWYDCNLEDLLPSQFFKWVHIKYKRDWIKFLEELYPKKKIEFWRLMRTSSTIWNNKKNVNQYLQWLSEKLNFRDLNDWYNLKVSDLTSNYGDGLYKRYVNLNTILKIKYPNENILVWKLSKVPSKTWNDKKTHLKFLNYIYKSLKFKKPEDWYSLTISQFHLHGGRSILKQYATLVDCILLNFPKLGLLPWKFKRCGRGFWNKSENRKWFVKWMIKQLGIKNKDEYYSIGEKHFIEYGGISVLSYYESSTAKCLIKLFPKLNLDFARFDNTSKTQFNLYRFFKFHIPNEKILYNYKHPDLLFSETKRKLEIDIFFVERSIGIEVQGEQHYRAAWGGIKELKKIKKRDLEKRNIFKKKKIKVFEIKQIKIPMAWDKLKIFLNKNYPSLINGS